MFEFLSVRVCLLAPASWLHDDAPILPVHQRVDMNNPLPQSRRHLHLRSARFTVLYDRMIRMEWAEDDVFEDRATLAVIHRHTTEVDSQVELPQDSCTIDTGLLSLSYRNDGKPFNKANLQVTFAHLDGRASWHPGMRDTGNLGGTHRTLDGCDGDKKEVWGDVAHEIEGWNPLPADHRACYHDMAGQ